MKKNIRRCYVFVGRNADVKYSSYGTKGSIQNYEDLAAQGRRSYGRYFELSSYESYKKDLNRVHREY